MEVYYNKNQCICLPFKVILGNFIEDLRTGADTIVRVSHQGMACRDDLCERYRQTRNGRGHGAQSIAIRKTPNPKGKVTVSSGQ